MNKSDILLNEAEIDLKLKCFNKSVSASYFAVRKEIEYLARKLGSTIPRRDDKLINILKHLGKDKLAEETLYLYERRKDADYGEAEIDERTAMICLDIAKRVIAEVRELSQSIT